ncbi:MAG TPA: asparagine synthase (glutamine-hydrolyzing) [Salinivirgaceae bacterium]|nr:asparagine synthase (glutamine-hydrolyzing) [Salinivirgaceae bacterium]
MLEFTGIHVLNNISLAEKEPTVTELSFENGFENSQVKLNKKFAVSYIPSTSSSKYNKNLPFVDITERYTVLFYGNFYNAQDCRNYLKNNSIEIRSNDICEIVLGLYILKGIKVFGLINGYFSLLIYDRITDTLVLSRDCYGKKNLYYYADDQKLNFATSIEHILNYNIDKSINHSALYGYFIHNYNPLHDTIIKGINKLKPGYAIISQNGGIEIKQWYILPETNIRLESYESAVNQLEMLVDNAVKIRLGGEDNIGCFLSGGIDSSIVTAIASRYKSNLPTFNIGFPNHPFFDETKWALIAAKHLKTDHRTIEVTENHLIETLPNVLDSLDEPFADSSVVLLYILAREAKKEINSVLTGDGADEVFGGYRKHLAHYKVAKSHKYRLLAKTMLPFFSLIPQTRKGKISDKARQLAKFLVGLSLMPSERYVRWASISTRKEVNKLLCNSEENADYYAFIKQLTDTLNKNDSIGEITKADIQLVLHGDMLQKLNFGLSPHALNARSPFIDHRVVDYALSLPDSYKVYGNFRKRILQDSFKTYLPEELFTRSKKGFELPLQSLLSGAFFDKIDKEYLNRDFVAEQGLFNFKYTEELKKRLFKPNVGDTPAKIWALVVFQHWYKKHLGI